MCKNRRGTLASDPKPRSSRSEVPTHSSASASSYPTDTSGYKTGTGTGAAASSSTSLSSLSSLHSSLPELPALYPFAEIRSATDNFHAGRLSSSSWRCSLRGRDAVVFQRPFRGDPSALPARLAAVCRSHHSSLVRLLGASLAGDCIYLAYDYTAGSSLADCLRSPRNPSFTALPSWTARIQVADDLAQGLEYIHRHIATVHNRIKSSSVIVTEPHFRAKICHFGTADLAGEIPAAAAKEITSEIAEISSPRVRRSGSWRMRIEGTRWYMAPEVIAGGDISQRSDVFAFGVVLLELLSGEEPLKYRFDKERGVYERVSVVETAREAIGLPAAEERPGRIRRWVDQRLRDSFPVEAAERLVGVALKCVEAEPGMRPEMTWVAGKMSKVLLESQAWGERVRAPADFSLSFTPR